MVVRLHPHARARIEERGVTEDEVRATVERGEQFPAKFGRTGFRCNFSSGNLWRGKQYSTKQVEAYAVREGSDWLVITVIARFF
jgi:hypothetical protein